MKTFAGLVAVALAFAPSATHAQGFINLQLGFQGPPPMVEVQPGIQVVEGVGEEVFFANGFYWCRRPNGWYRANGLDGRFGWVDGRFVPGGLRGFPIGRYRNWHHEGWRAGDRPGMERRGEIRGGEHRAEVRHEAVRQEVRHEKAGERHEEKHEEEHRH